MHVSYLCINLLLVFVLAGCGIDGVDAGRGGVTGTTADSDKQNVEKKTDNAAINISNRSETNKAGFAVYMVKDNSVKRALLYGFGESGKYSDYKKIDLNGLEIESIPLFTDKDIESYNWKKQTITFNTRFLDSNPLSQEDIKMINEKKDNTAGGISVNFYGGSKLLKCSDMDAVLIIASDSRIYASGFALPAWSSRMPPEICIEDSGLNSIKIKISDGLESIVKDKHIYNLFKKSEKLIE